MYGQPKNETKDTFLHDALLFTVTKMFKLDENSKQAVIGEESISSNEDKGAAMKHMFMVKFW